MQAHGHEVHIVELTPPQGLELRFVGADEFPADPRLVHAPVSATAGSIVLILACGHLLHQGFQDSPGDAGDGECQGSDRSSHLEE
jgi:hypothetical protein